MHRQPRSRSRRHTSSHGSITAHAPGRVNLIGDHTDYTGGLALPIAIGLGVEVHGRRGGDRVTLTSSALSGIADMPLDPGVLDPGGVEPAWARYVAGVLAELDPDDGFFGTVVSTLPVGCGLSSSAALETALALAFGARADDPRALALLCQRAEHRAVGVPCGIMDQLVIAHAIEGMALRVDCRSLDLVAVPFPDDVDVVVVDSHQERALTGTAYAERVAQCASVEAQLGSLRDLRPGDVDVLADPVLRRRARHVTTENERVDGLFDALAAHDLGHAGQLMVSSHASLRDDFEVSTPALDQLVQHLCRIPGVFGARLTGAGFGGCAVVLCDAGTDLGIHPVWRGRPAPAAHVIHS